MNAGTQEVAEDEISLTDLVRKLLAGWRWLAGGALLGGTIAGVVLSVQPALWEATALVRVGQVGQVGQVETIPATIERLKSAAFIDEISQKITVGKSDHGVAAINPQPKKDTTFIEIKVLAGSPESASKAAEAVITSLVERHSVIAASGIQNLKSELMRVSSRLHELEAIQKELANKVLGISPKTGSMFTEYVMLVSAMLGKDAEMMQLRQRESELIFALDPSNTFPTGAIERVMVSAGPVSPKVSKTLALGVCVGLIFGVLAIFFRNVFRKP